MSDVSETTSTSPSADTGTDVAAPPVRSTTSVLVVLGAILLVPVVALLFAFAPRGGGGGAGAQLVKGLDDDAVHAVYLTNDNVYFGFVGDAHGDFFVLEDAFFLRSAASEGDKGDEAEPTLQTVPVSEEVGGDGNLLVNGNEVLRVQALTKDSNIAKAVEPAKE